MAAKLDSSLISNIVQEATQKIIDNTNQFLESVSTTPVGNDTITVMSNGAEIIMNKSDYDEMKKQNDEIRSEMKAKISEVVNEFKINIKKQSKKPTVDSEDPSANPDELIK